MGSTSILDEDPNFIDLAIELASVLRHTIFLDQVLNLSSDFVSGDI